jgi:hypothetical protein
VDGRIAGVWKHDIRRGTAQIAIEPFIPLPKRTRAAAEKSAAAIGTLLGAPVTVTWGAASGG